MEDATPEPLASWPADAPVLMSDWLLRPVAALKPGDVVVGLEPGCRASRSKMVPATVLTVATVPAEFVDLDLKSSNAVRCSPDALWYTNRFPGPTEPHRKTYSPARPGAAIMQVDLVEDPPTGRAHLMWHWLAGMADGEGHIADSSLPITQTTSKNGPVWDKLCEVLDALGIEYNAREHPREGNWQPRSDAVIRNVRDVYRRLLRYADPGKRQQMIDALWRRPRKPIRAHDSVLAIGPSWADVGWQITTTSGNQVVWGYLASNFALSTLCPAGHALDIRKDGAGKTYQTCRTCGPSPVAALANERRRRKTAARRVICQADVELLAMASDAVTSGQARALRLGAGMTQVQFAGLCDVSQPRLSGWESGSVIPSGLAGIRYAKALAKLRAGG
jgi:DNA-binding transcriptional regulator YiaG